MEWLSWIAARPDMGEGRLTVGGDPEGVLSPVLGAASAGLKDEFCKVRSGKPAVREF